MNIKSYISVVLFALLISSVLSQDEYASSYYELEIPQPFPLFTFSSLDKNQILQQTTVTLLQVVELILPDNQPPTNSTMVVASSFIPEMGIWNITTDTKNNKNGDYAKTNISCYSSNRPMPEWNELTFALDWENVEYNTNFTLQIIVKNYTWVNPASTTTLAFMIGFDSANYSDIIPTANTTTVTLGSAFFKVAVNADIESPSDPDYTTSPTWVWMNMDVIVVQIGHFDGTGAMVQNITIGNIYNLPIIVVDSPDWGMAVLITTVGLIVILAIGVVMVVATAFYLRKRTARADYEPL